MGHNSLVNLSVGFQSSAIARNLDHESKLPPGYLLHQFCLENGRFRRRLQKRSTIHCSFYKILMSVNKIPKVALCNRNAIHRMLSLSFFEVLRIRASHTSSQTGPVAAWTYVVDQRILKQLLPHYPPPGAKHSLYCSGN